MSTLSLNKFASKLIEMDTQYKTGLDMDICDHTLMEEYYDAFLIGLSVEEIFLSAVRFKNPQMDTTELESQINLSFVG